MKNNPFSVDIKPDWEGFLRCIQRKGTPERVHYIELYLDQEVQQAICERYGLLDHMDKDDPFYEQKSSIVIQRFLGYDYVRCSIEGMEMNLKRISTEDTAKLKRKGGRHFIEEHKGPVTNWEEFESFPWPDPKTVSTRSLEWYEKNLPEDMCIIGSGNFAHFSEQLLFLMGYETLCYALYDQRDLVADISKKLIEINKIIINNMLEFERVKILWGSDDMGFRTQTFISPDDLREFVLPGHKLMAQISHKANRPYLLHSCGNLKDIMNDLINDIGIDAKHSFEDTIEDVIEVNNQYKDKIAILGGIDVDFLCRADEEQIRERVFRTLENCIPGGGYCLGTGNSVANYIPIDNYITMLDEGRKYNIDFKI